MLFGLFFCTRFVPPKKYVTMELAHRQEMEQENENQQPSARRRASVSITRLIRDEDSIELSTEIMAQLTSATSKK